MTIYQKVAITMAVLTLAISINVSAIYASPTEAEQMMTNFFQQEEQRDILEAFEDNDYEKWKKMVGVNSKIAKIVTKEKFNAFIKARAFARQGRYEEAVKLADELKKEIQRDLPSGISKNQA